MQIDWLTVAAQIVNFLVLVYLLKRFLYGPVIAAMGRRQARVAQELADAATREREADAKMQAYQQKIDAFERDRAAMLETAGKDVEQHRKALLDDARRDVDASRAAWQQAVAREQREFLGGLRARAARSLLETARRLLIDLADAELERQIVRTFLQRLNDLDASKRDALRTHGSDGVELASAFDLDDDARAAIEQTLANTVFEGRTPQIRYVHADRLICGIELRCAGYKVGWSLGSHLETFERDVAAALPGTAAAGSETDDARTGS